MTQEWSRYWRSPDSRLEAMHAHFEQHVYHRHSHETYSFGVTEQGVQEFGCRGGQHLSAAGMVMSFNPDDPHDGHAADDLGFTYRMVHIAPDLVSEVLADRSGRTTGLPLFRRPVNADAQLADALRVLHAALLDGASALRQDELLAAAVAAMVWRGAETRVPVVRSAGTDVARIAAQARELLDAAYADDLRASDLAAATGRSRYAVYRAFAATYGLAPSDYQRQVRLRAARGLLAAGEPIGSVPPRLDLPIRATSPGGSPGTSASRPGRTGWRLTNRTSRPGPDRPWQPRCLSHPTMGEEAEWTRVTWPAGWRC